MAARRFDVTPYAALAGGIVFVIGFVLGVATRPSPAHTRPCPHGTKASIGQICVSEGMTVNFAYEPACFADRGVFNVH